MPDDIRGNPPEQALETAPPPPPVVAADPTDALVLEEIEKLRNKRGSWQSAITLALLSLVAFVTIGRVKWSWDIAVLLTVMIVIHELGHYVAMRAFHYADLRMFFVPLLGAAVTGRHYNVKGWQRAVVYLAGPVPGIVLGVMLMIAGFLTGSPWIEKAALVALLLNGLNLLPFVPLDGGWVLHAVLFSRHFILEAAFLAAAGFVLIAASWAGQGRLWMYLGILILVGLPVSFRMARIAARLRARGIPAASPDDQSIPTATALAILQELKQSPMAIRSPKQLARQTLDVFQKLNATPPGILASIGLLAMYLGAGVAALVGSFTLFISHLGAFVDPTQHHVTPLRFTLDPAQVHSAGLTNESALDPASPLVVATFPDSSRARSVFAATALEISAPDRAILFGHSILVASPQEANRWLHWFENQRAETFVEATVSNATAVVKLVCEAPDEPTAVQLETECAAYLHSEYLKAWPPWADISTLDGGSAVMLKRLRHTARSIEQIQTRVATNPELVQLSRSGLDFSSAAALERLTRRASLERKLQRQELQNLLGSNDPLLETEIVQEEWSRMNESGAQADSSNLDKQSPVWEFGSLPLDRTPENPQAWRAADGSVRREKRKLRFGYLSFYRTDCGLPALVSYLARNGCAGFTYEIEKP